MAVIYLRNLDFQYPGQKNKTLSIRALDITQGEKIFLFGPSGSGKSTLLEILAGVQSSDSWKAPSKSGSEMAELKILDKNLAQMSSAERDAFRGQHIGYIFQSFNLVPYLSVEENILLPLIFSRGSVDVHIMKNRMRTLCDRLGIAEYLQKRATELSIGQQQRVAAARALLQKPEIILADEPTSSLDYDHREKFLNVLFELSAESSSTILFVSHDRSIAGLFDRVISMNEINHVDDRSNSAVKP